MKARSVSDFRKEQLDLPKVRMLNDYHHAKDAYLNIVVGNVYYEKFTNDPLRWLKKTKDRNYNLDKLFENDFIKNDKVIWKRGNQGTIKTVMEQMKKNNIQYTRYATTNKTGQNGGLFDQNPVGKDKKPSIPLKKGMDVKKYGGYKTITPAYFALVEYEKKGKKLRSIEAVPLYLKQAFENGTENFEEYCAKEYGLNNPKVIIPVIKKDACIVINGFPTHLRGTTGKQLILQNGVQLYLNNELELYLKKIEKYLQRNEDQKGKENLQIGEKDGITKDQNIKLYDELLRKMNDKIYQYRENLKKDLETRREKFLGLSVEEQCMVINQIFLLFRCIPKTADLRLIGGASHAGGLFISKNISNYKFVALKNQSVTGLFEQTIELLKI